MRWMHQYVAYRNVFRDCLKLFPPSCPSGNSRPTDQPHRKPVGHKSWVGGAVRPGAVRWRIGDVAVMRHLRLVGTIPRGMEALDRADSWTPWRRACTRLAQEDPANVARYGGVATSLDRTSGYRWLHGLRHSIFVVVCWSKLSAHLPGQRCSSQCATQRTNVRVWTPILCRVNAEIAEVVGLTSRNWTRWRWSAISPHGSKCSNLGKKMRTIFSISGRGKSTLSSLKLMHFSHCASFWVCDNTL